jgi:hypothetical protein
MMCERRDAQRAQDAAADALTEACRLMCPDEIGATLRKVYDETLKEAVPDELKELIGKLQ